MTEQSLFTGDEARILDGVSKLANEFKISYERAVSNGNLVEDDVKALAWDYVWAMEVVSSVDESISSEAGNYLSQMWRESSKFRDSYMDLKDVYRKVDDLTLRIGDLGVEPAYESNKINQGRSHELSNFFDYLEKFRS